LEVTGQHPWRPAHIHFKVGAEGQEPLITQVFFPEDPYLDNDTIGAVKPGLVRALTRHEDEEELARRGLDAPFYTCEFDITLKPVMSAARA
jgi:catechol 1,2-dioxygenase